MVDCFNPELVDIRLAVVAAPSERGDAVMILCPFRNRHKDRTASLAVYAANVHCFGCGFHLSRRYESLAFVLGLWNGKGDGKRAAIMAGSVAHLFVSRPIVREEKTLQPLNNSDALPYRIHLWSVRPDRLVYLCDWRGLSRTTVDRARIGYDVCRFVLPVYDAAGNLLTFRYRYDDTALDNIEKKYTGMAGRNQTYLYPAWELSKLAEKGMIDDLWVVEGEFDVWPLLERGISAVTLTNGAQQVYKVLEIIRSSLGRSANQVCRRVVLATDQDGPGNAAAQELSLVCDRAGLPWTRASWGTGKDITEYLRGGGRMEDITYAGVQTELGTGKGATQTAE